MNDHTDTQDWVAELFADAPATFEPFVIEVPPDAPTLHVNTGTCRRCGGSGRWTNGRRSGVCYGCHGTGERKSFDWR
jgi:hypothetical protein